MTDLIIIFSIIFIISLFSLIMSTTQKKQRKTNKKPFGSIFPKDAHNQTDEKKVKKIDEAYGDTEDIWAKFDQEEKERDDKEINK